MFLLRFLDFLNESDVHSLESCFDFIIPGKVLQEWIRRVRTQIGDALRKSDFLTIQAISCTVSKTTEEPLNHVGIIDMACLDYLRWEVVGILLAVSDSRRVSFYSPFLGV